MPSEHLTVPVPSARVVPSHLLVFASFSIWKRPKKSMLGTSSPCITSPVLLTVIMGRGDNSPPHAANIRAQLASAAVDLYLNARLVKVISSYLSSVLTTICKEMRHGIDSIHLRISFTEASDFSAVPDWRRLATAFTKDKFDICSEHALYVSALNVNCLTLLNKESTRAGLGKRGNDLVLSRLQLDLLTLT